MLHELVAFTSQLFERIRHCWADPSPSPTGPVPNGDGPFARSGQGGADAYHGQRGDSAVTLRVIAAFAGPEPPAPPAEVDRLTAREQDVLRLLAEGLTNAEIAARVYLGEATGKTHLSRILLELGLRTRVQAVVYAYRNGPVRG